MSTNYTLDPWADRYEDGYDTGFEAGYDVADRLNGPTKGEIVALLTLGIAIGALGASLVILFLA